MEKNKGYLIIAQTKQDRRQASACAFSIKNANPGANTSLVVSDLNAVEVEYEEAFDNIIELPYNAKTIARANDWQSWWVTPYDETIVIDCASIVNTNLDTIWDYCENSYDLVFPGTIKDFKHTTIKHDARKEWYNKFKLTSVYTGWFYFKKNETSMDYFKLADPYMQHYIDLYQHKLEPQYIPDYYDSNLTHSMILQDSAMLDCIDYNLHYVDMDLVSYQFKHKVEKWTDYLNVWNRSNGTVKLQNYANTGILYYKEADFLTNEIYDGQRNSYRLQTKVLRQV